MSRGVGVWDGNDNDDYDYVNTQLDQGPERVLFIAPNSLKWRVFRDVSHCGPRE